MELSLQYLWEETVLADFVPDWERVCAQLWRDGGMWAELELQELPPRQAGWHLMALVVKSPLPFRLSTGLQPNAHISVAYREELPEALAAEMCRRWGSRRWLWLPLAWLSRNGTVEIAETSELHSCPLLSAAHAQGSYWSRTLHFCT